MHGHEPGRQNPVAYPLEPCPLKETSQCKRGMEMGRWRGFVLDAAHSCQSGTQPRHHPAGVGAGKGIGWWSQIEYDYATAGSERPSKVTEEPSRRTIAWEGVGGHTEVERTDRFPGNGPRRAVQHVAIRGDLSPDFTFERDIGVPYEQDAFAWLGARAFQSRVRPPAGQSQGGGAVHETVLVGHEADNLRELTGSGEGSHGSG